MTIDQKSAAFLRAAYGTIERVSDVYETWGKRMPLPPGLITIAQAAKKVGYHPSTLRHAIADGQLKAVKPGHDWLVDIKDVRAWIKRPKQAGGRKPKGT